MRLVGPGGILLTCSCSGAIDSTLFQQIVFAAQLESGAAFSLFGRQGAGPDHPVSLDCPEGEYLKGMWLVRVEPERGKKRKPSLRLSGADLTFLSLGPILRLR